MSKYIPKNMPYENVIVARQPIFDRDNDVWGYELLYRASDEDKAALLDDPEFATMLVSTCCFMTQAESAGSQRLVSINFTENLIIDLAPLAMPPTTTVVEVACTVSPSEAVLEALTRLKRDGYLIAVDGYRGEPGREGLLALADVIKIDVLGLHREEVRGILQGIRGNPARKVAEKVDNHDTHKMCVELGFDLFQGYFYAMPHTISGKKISASVHCKAELLLLIEEHSEDLDKLVDAVEVDPSLGYRLLRYINSPAFGLYTEVDTIKRAADLLGLKRLCRWLQMVLMSDIAPRNKTIELYRRSLERAKFFESATKAGHLSVSPGSAFTFGLLSLLGSLLDMDMADVLRQLPLSEELKQGYQDEATRLHQFLDLVRMTERSDLEHIPQACAALGLAMEEVSEMLKRSAAWTENVCTVIYG